MVAPPVPVASSHHPPSLRFRRAPATWVTGVKLPCEVPQRTNLVQGMVLAMNSGAAGPYLALPRTVSFFSTSRTLCDAELASARERGERKSGQAGQAVRGTGKKGTEVQRKTGKAGDDPTRTGWGGGLKLDHRLPPASVGRPRRRPWPRAASREPRARAAGAAGRSGRHGGEPRRQGYVLPRPGQIMSVLIETSAGDVVVDMYVEDCPRACENFLTLCALKYYHKHLFFNVQENYLVQCGDPTGTGMGGSSAWGVLHGDRRRFFPAEVRANIKHDRPGLLCMARCGTSGLHASQFFLTLRGEDMGHLDGKHTIFGEVAEGMDVVQRIGEQFCDEAGRPYRDVRVLHTYILDNPFEASEELQRRVPSSPRYERPPEEKLVPRTGDLGGAGTCAGGPEGALEKERRDAHSRATVLEMLGDIDDAKETPPENVLFVAKLNPVTTEEALEIIFSRFGDCSVYIVQDRVTGQSLNYGFVEFTQEAHCVEAYLKMNNVMIDDRRILVDFSQSTSKNRWNGFLRLSKERKRSRNAAKGANADGGSADGSHRPSGPAQGPRPGRKRGRSPEGAYGRPAHGRLQDRQQGRGPGHLGHRWDAMPPAGWNRRDARGAGPVRQNDRGYEGRRPGPWREHEDRDHRPERWREREYREHGRERWRDRRRR